MIDADNNKLILEDQTEVNYNALGLNVGSRTRGTRDVNRSLPDL